MITKPTVFVLGAGVSMPYGFPSGNLLVEQICGATGVIPFEDDKTAIIDKGAIHQILNSCFGEKETLKFGKALHLSQKLSIDSFLEHRVEFIEIGKLAISLFILRKEIASNLFDFENRDKKCYQYLFNKLNTGWEEFAENRIGFITFNYDRSLEHFLFTSLQNSYGKSDSECAELINRIPIMHVHGSLGNLPWQHTEGIEYGAMLQKYSNPLQSSIIAPSIAASKQIKIVAENQSSQEFQRAFELLRQAENLYFLGFSYHPTSMERLRLGDQIKISQLKKTYQDESMWVKHSHMQGTALGMEDAEINSIQNKWHVRLPDRHCDSLQFLRRFAILD